MTAYANLGEQYVDLLEERLSCIVGAIRKHRDSQLFRERTIVDSELYSQLPEGPSLSPGTNIGESTRRKERR